MLLLPPDGRGAEESVPATTPRLHGRPCSELRSPSLTTGPSCPLVVLFCVLFNRTVRSEFASYVLSDAPELTL